MGQKATTGGLIETARFRGVSSRPMSASSAKDDFVPRLPQPSYVRFLG
jgi:hypothetical protein